MPVFDPKWTRFAPKSPKTSPVLFQYIMCYYILYNSTGSSLKGRCWGGKNGKEGKLCNRIIRPNLFNTFKYGLNIIRRIIRIRRVTHPWKFLSTTLCSQIATYPKTLIETLACAIVVTHSCSHCDNQTGLTLVCVSSFVASCDG